MMAAVPAMTEEVERMLTCPISLGFMQDPVTLVQSGHTYDRESLCQSLLHNPYHCPMTGQRFEEGLQYIDCLPIRQLLTMHLGDGAYQKYDDSTFKRQYSAVTSYSKDFATYEELEALLFGMNRRQIDCVAAQQMVNNASQDDAVVVGFKALLLHPETCPDRRLHKDQDEALRMWERAEELGLSADVEAGNVWALWLKGVFKLGLVEQAVDTVNDYFVVSAAKGHAASQFYLGYLYLNGRGVQRDYETAAEYFEEAADQGNAEALYYLGYFYQHGKCGVPQDYEKAKEYYELGAQEGDARAKLMLDQM